MARPQHVDADEWNEFQRGLKHMQLGVDTTGYGRPLLPHEMHSVDEKNLGNDAAVELQWAMKAGKHAETYFQLVQKFPSERIKLSKIDDQIYAHFRRVFLDFDVSMISMDSLKSDQARVTWRDFMKPYEGRIKDWNFGTLLRMDASQEYGPDNSEIVPRIQFVAIEIARNREGANDAVKLNTI